MSRAQRPGPLEALANYYGRMPDAQPPGWSREKFGWCVVLNQAGVLVDVVDLRAPQGKKLVPRLMLVPAAKKRTAGIVSNFLWDKTSYSLGRTGKPSERTKDEHAAFQNLHRVRLKGSHDDGLVAFLRFLDAWRPEHFDRLRFRDEMLDANVMFRLEDDDGYLHERPAVRQLLNRQDGTGGRPTVFCLATNEWSVPARLHPTIKGVEGAQTAGASLVSFNLEAFNSYDKEQGENAPTSEAAAFRYGAALNRLLERDSRNRVSRPIGDTTVVFWADASNATAAEAADAWFATASTMVVNDADEAREIGKQLEAIASGRPLSTAVPNIEPGTEFHVLGLAPNAARLSVRFWLSDTIEVFAQRVAQHHSDLSIEPVPWNRPPAYNYLLAQTVAFGGDFKNIPHGLAGELLRAILSGSLYPRVWLAAALMRLRSGDDPSTGWHAAAIRAVLTRQRRRQGTPNGTQEKGPPMSLDRDHGNIGYQLGRLFAILELAQRAALGTAVKATIRDKFFGAASATPASVFPLIIANSQHHLSRVRKDKKGWAVLIERELEEVMGRITPTMPFSLPRALRLEDQGEFAIGYYHQRKARLSAEHADEPTLEQQVEEGAEDDE